MRVNALLGSLTLTTTLFFAATNACAEVIHFQDALAALYKTSLYQATESEIQAIQLDFESKDLILAPYLELSAERLNDHRQLLFTSSATKRRTDNYSLTLTKPFSTGTALSLNSDLENALTPLVAPPG